MWPFGKKKQNVNDRMREVLTRNRICTNQNETDTTDIKTVIQAIEKAVRDSLHLKNKSNVKIDYTVNTYSIVIKTNISRDIISQAKR